VGVTRPRRFPSVARLAAAVNPEFIGKTGKTGKYSTTISWSISRPRSSKCGRREYVVVMVDIMPKISGVEFEEAWSRRVDVQIDDDLSVPFISRQHLLIAKLAAGRAQDLIDVDALRESSQSQEIDQQQSPSSPAKNPQNELEQIRKVGREDWFKQRQQKGSAVTLEELRAKGREDWLKLRQQQTRENSRDPPDRSAEEDQDAKPDHLAGRLDKGVDDDL